MKIQIHNLVKNPDGFTLNLGIGFLPKFKVIALGFLFFSITICWAEELKEGQDVGDSQNMEEGDTI